MASLELDDSFFSVSVETLYEMGEKDDTDPESYLRKLSGVVYYEGEDGREVIGSWHGFSFNFYMAACANISKSDLAWFFAGITGDVNEIYTTARGSQKVNALMERDYARVVFLDYLELEKSWRGKGIGTRVMKLLLEAFKDDTSVVLLMVGANGPEFGSPERDVANKKIMNAWKAAGFKAFRNSMCMYAEPPL